MVANVLEMEPEAVLERLRAMGEQHAHDPEYQALRRELPADWSF